VIDGAQFQGLLEAPEGLLGIDELPVAQGHVLRLQPVVRRPEQVLAIEAFFSLGLGPVDG
jgi:hypothetical protein